MEGDFHLGHAELNAAHFNPLPPHGGRPGFGSDPVSDWAFQSTPSAWRETCMYPQQMSVR